MLGSDLCPWLYPSLTRLERAHHEGRLGHAWLIHGPEGLGKTNLALVFAGRLLNAASSEPPRTLQARDFLEGMRNRHEDSNHHPDLHWIHPESGKQTIGVEQIRALCESLELSSYSSANKVAIIEPAETMTMSAANALLKTLEEPTRGSFLLLVSHRPGLLPATIRSRCQQLRLQTPELAEISDWLNETNSSADALSSAAPRQTPLQRLEGTDGDAAAAESSQDNQLAEIIRRRGNPLAIADQWAKGDIDHTLAWLVRVIHGLIRLRFVEHGSKLITESGDASLHNAAQTLSVRVLFERLEEAERLRRELAGGINVQLAMRALLLGFVPDKGTT